MALDDSADSAEAENSVLKQRKILLKRENEIKNRIEGAKGIIGWFRCLGYKRELKELQESSDYEFFVRRTERLYGDSKKTRIPAISVR